MPKPWLESYAVRDAAMLEACRKKTKEQQDALAAAGGVLQLMKDDIPTSVTDPRFKPEHWQRLQAEAIVQEAEAKLIRLLMFPGIGC